MTLTFSGSENVFIQRNTNIALNGIIRNIHTFLQISCAKQIQTEAKFLKIRFEIIIMLRLIVSLGILER